MDLETSKNLGGVGAILVVVSGLGFVGTGFAGLLSIVGLILLLIALKGFSDNYKDMGIFNNALYAVIAVIVGAVVATGTFFVTIFSVIPPDFDWTNPMAWQQRFMDFDTFWATFGGIVIGLIVALVLLFVFFVIAFMFFRRSMSILATKTGVGMFATAGLLMMIGAVLTVILVGVILIWVGFILLAVAFFSIRTTAAPQPATTPPSQ